MAKAKKPEKKTRKKSVGKANKTGFLTQMQRVFVENYFKCPNNDMIKAYIDAGGKSRTPNVHASKMFALPQCQSYYNELADEQKERVGIDADAVLKMMVDVVTCDVNEIMQHRLESCRYCYGINHEFHWIDEAEYERACQVALSKAEDGDEAIIPSNGGGYGFDPNDSPHAKCPQCHGNGKARVHVSDTRKLTGSAKLIYDGVEITKNGLKIKTLSRDKALYALAKKYGHLNDRILLDTPTDSPFAELIKQVSGNTLRPPSQD